MWSKRSDGRQFKQSADYTRSFGLQWNRYRRVQIDCYNGTTLSHDRLFGGTGWRPEELRGQKILEVGCGAGRFTQVLLDADAEVYAIDSSTAVYACRQNNAPHPRLHMIQADLYALPFRNEVFDRIFCYGVLQHTPDVKRAFLSLIPFLKKGGVIAIDVYHKRTGLDRIGRWESKRLWRPLTTRLPPLLLARIVEWYVPRWLPIDTRLERIPLIGRLLVSFIPCWNYHGRFPLTQEQLTEWAILDTFDALATRYDSPQRIEDVRGWFEEAGFTDIDVRFSGNGIVGDAKKPAAGTGVGR